MFKFLGHDITHREVKCMIDEVDADGKENAAILLKPFFILPIVFPGNGSVEFNEFLKMMNTYYSKTQHSYSEENDILEAFKVIFE